MLLSVVEVHTQPLWTDEWMVWLTAGSIAVSAFLGFLALWNGFRAGRIAEESTRIAREVAERDEFYRYEESRLRDERERAKVVLSMHEALNQFVVWTETRPSLASETSREAVSEFRKKRVLALARIDSYAQGEDLKLRTWFNMALARIEKLGLVHNVDLQRVYDLARRIREDVNAWKAGAPVHDLKSVPLPQNNASIKSQTPDTSESN